MAVGSGACREKHCYSRPLGSDVLLVEVGITSAICMRLVPNCSIRRILHDGGDHENGLHDERNSDHGKPMKFDAKMRRCLGDVLGDQSPCGQMAHCV